MSLNPSSSYIGIDPMNGDRDQHTFAVSHQVTSPASTLSSASYRIFCNPTRDHAGYYGTQDQDENHGGGVSCEVKNKVSNGLKLTLWKTEDQADDVVPGTAQKNIISRVVMRKIKKNDGSVAQKAEKLQPSSSLETDISSNSCSYTSSPIRVCADCNTTKTPLWRSGPKGPKSLCNACGIRQRKARRAMAAAAGTAAVVSDQPPAVRIKVQQKEKIGKNNKHSSNLKKRSNMGAGSSNNGENKLSFEDFLKNLNNKLSFQRVFPQDEKDAAILLMALSSGLVHG